MYLENKFTKSLVINAQQGKLVALIELFEINISQVYTLVSRLSGNKLIADRLTKHILVRAWERISEDGPGEQLFSDWIRELAVHITVDELRTPALLNDKKYKKNLKKNAHRADYSSNTSEKIVAGLDTEYRIIFVLNRIEHYNLYQVSNFMGFAESVTEIKLSEAIEQITRALTNSSKEEDQNEIWLNLQQVIEPDKNILKSAFEEIQEIRTSEIKEKEDDAESKREIEAREREELKQYEESKKKGRDKESEPNIIISNESRKKREFKLNKKIIFRFALPVLIAGFFIYSFTSTDSWKVYSILGNPLLNKETFSESISISPGDLVTVDEVSSAKIEIPEIGKMKVFSGTSVKRLKTDNSFRLLHGKLAIDALRANENLSMVVPNAKIQVFQHGVDYCVQVDKRGNSVIDLDAGWLHVSSGNNVTILPKNYSLRVVNGGGVSMPYHSNSSSNLNTLLEEYLFNGKRGVTLNKILELSTKKESITLWNLLQRVKPKHRGVVYTKLYQLVPHPDHVSRNDLLELDRDPLQVWLEEIDWSM